MNSKNCNSGLFIAIILSLFTFSCTKESFSISNEPVPLPSSTQIKIIRDTLDGHPIMLVGSAEYQFIQAFDPRLSNGIHLDFKPSLKGVPLILVDNSGSEWNIFGEAVSGPNKGLKLQSYYASFGYWMTWSSTFPGISLNKQPNESVNLDTKSDDPAWLLSRENIYRGALMDAIQSIDNPAYKKFVFRESLDYGFFLNDDELVSLVKIEDEILVYPDHILQHHEIVNDQIANTKFSVIFGPYSGIASVWNSNVNENNLTFGVSGLVYNNNILPFDKESGTIWSQILRIGINGELQGQSPHFINCIQTKWGTVKEMYDNIKVLSPDLGFDIDYRLPFLADYTTNDQYIPFPLTYNDDRLAAKQSVFGVVIGQKAKAYTIDLFN